MDLVEQIGSGIRRIMQLCGDANINKPKLIVENDWVTVVFERNISQDDLVENSD